MMTLVVAGYGLGFSSLTKIAGLNNPDVVARPLDGCPTMLTTYLIRREGEPAEQLLANSNRFKELQRQCRDDWDKQGNAQCNAMP